jgi:hypothetical protein
VDCPFMPLQRLGGLLGNPLFLLTQINVTATGLR